MLYIVLASISLLYEDTLVYNHLIVKQETLNCDKNEISILRNELSKVSL
jgi:hypothetical protein